VNIGARVEQGQSGGDELNALCRCNIAFRDDEASARMICFRASADRSSVSRPATASATASSTST
jgi:hypothetical protein